MPGTQRCATHTCHLYCYCRTAVYRLQYKDNMEQRLKYADAPDKFMDSELDLDEHIKSLMQVRTVYRLGVPLVYCLYCWADDGPPMYSTTGGREEGGRRPQRPAAPGVT